MALGVPKFKLSIIARKTQLIKVRLLGCGHSLVTRKNVEWSVVSIFSTQRTQRTQIRQMAADRPLRTKSAQIHILCIVGTPIRNAVCVQKETVVT